MKEPFTNTTLNNEPSLTLDELAKVYDDMMANKITEEKGLIILSDDDKYKAYKVGKKQLEMFLKLENIRIEHEKRFDNVPSLKLESPAEYPNNYYGNAFRLGCFTDEYVSKIIK